MACRVFVVQVPSRIDHGTKQWMPMVDLSAAKRFGEINVMLPPEAGRLATVPLIQAVRECMSGFTRDDYLLTLGDPLIFAAAACIAAIKTGGRLKMLKWDRQTSDYFPVEFQV